MKKLLIKIFRSGIGKILLPVLIDFIFGRIDQKLKSRFDSNPAFYEGVNLFLVYTKEEIIEELQKENPVHQLPL